MPNNLGISDEEFERRFDFELDFDECAKKEKDFFLNFIGPIKPPCKHKWRVQTVFEMCAMDGEDVIVYKCTKCKKQYWSDTPWWDNSDD